MATGTPATALLARGMESPFTLHPYGHDPRAEAFGEEAAAALGVDPGRIFKTLIATVDGASSAPSCPSPASSTSRRWPPRVGGKRAEMADRPPRPAPPGTSSVGSRRSASGPACRSSSTSRRERFDTVYVSAGRRGLQVQLAPADLIA